MPRAISPVVGTITLVVLTVLVAATVVTVVPPSLGSTPTAAFDLAADADENKLVVTHRAGDPIAVDTLDIKIVVNNEPLPHQPPVPFVGATGYYQAPSGPFNPEFDGSWHTGVRASLTIAASNEDLSVGDTVRTTLLVDGTIIADLETVAG